MEKGLKQKLATGILWKTLEEACAKAVGLIVSIVLARLLVPEDYAVIALIAVMLAIMDVFINSGLPSALIQKKDADDVDFSSVLYVNIFFCTCVYLLMFFLAPIIADFYSMPILVPVTRVLSIKVLISAVKSVEHAFVARKMIFKKFFFATIIGTVISAIVGIVLAYNGYGVWALVAQQLTNNFIDTIVLWFTIQWRPVHKFSIEKTKALLSFGYKIVAAELLNEVYNNIRTLIIGKFYTAADLAYYSKGREYPSSISSSLNASYNSVIFSALAKQQDDIILMKQTVKRGIKISFYFTSPVMMGLAAIAEPLIRLFLTDKWISAVPFFRIFCFEFLFASVQIINTQVPKALGRSDITFKIELIKKILLTIVLVISAFWGVYAIALGVVLSQVFVYNLNAYPVGKLIKYPILSQLKDLLPELLLTISMGIIVYCIKYLISDHLVFLLIVQILIGVIIYVLFSYIFKIDSFFYVLSIVKRKIVKKRSI